MQKLRMPELSFSFHLKFDSFLRCNRNSDFQSNVVNVSLSVIITLLFLSFFCDGGRGALLEFQFWVKGISAFLFSFVDEIIFDCKVAIPYYKALIDSSLNLKNDKSNGNLISPLKSIKLKANAAFSQHSCTRY